MSKKTPFLLPFTQFIATSVNTSTENSGSGENARKKILKSVDIELEASVKVLEQLATADKIDYQREFFHNDGTPKELGLGKLPYTNEYNDQIIVIAGDKAGETGLQLISKKIHKFSAKLSTGKIAKLHLQFQIYPDNQATTWALDELLVHPHYLKIEGPVQMDIEDAA
jgi:hypothetical protein